MELGDEVNIISLDRIGTVQHIFESGIVRVSTDDGRSFYCYPTELMPIQKCSTHCTEEKNVDSIEFTYTVTKKIGERSAMVDITSKEMPLSRLMHLYNLESLNLFESKNGKTYTKEQIEEMIEWFEK